MVVDNHLEQEHQSHFQPHISTLHLLIPHAPNLFNCHNELAGRYHQHASMLEPPTEIMSSVNFRHLNLVASKLWCYPSLLI